MVPPFWPRFHWHNSHQLAGAGKAHLDKLRGDRLLRPYFTCYEWSFAACEKLLLSSDFYKLLGLVEIDRQASAGPLKAVRPFHRDGLREREQ